MLRRCVAVLALTASVAAQEISLGGERPVPGKQHVALMTDSLTVESDHAQTVEVRLRVDPGFHINSHTPKDELLLPTVLKLDAGSVHVEKTAYPSGHAYKFSGSDEVLDVYQGEVRIALTVIAPKGASVLTGVLRYQACDNAACYPPRSLPVRIAVTGK